MAAFSEACKKWLEVKEEEKDLVSVLRIKPQATNDDIQDALSRIFAGRDVESNALSVSNSTSDLILVQAQDQNQDQNSVAVQQLNGPEPIAQLLVLSSAVRLDQQLKDQIRAILSTKYPYFEVLQELESESEVTRGSEKFRAQ